MEENLSTTVETSTSAPEVSAPATTEPAAAAPATSATTASGGSPDTAAPAAPAWTPDWKFKAGKAEHEIPEMYRSLAKDQKTLDEVKRLHEKAYGVDALVQSRDSLKKQISDLQPRLNEYENVTKNIERLEYFVQNKDFDSFFQAVGIPEKAIIGWIQEKIDLQGAAPEVRAQYERNRLLTQQQWDHQQEIARYKTQAEQFEQHQAYQTVQSSVSSLAADVAQNYDAKMGDGAFVDLVINKGIQLTQALGREPAIEQVVELAKQDLIKLGVLTAAPVTPAAAPQGTAQAKPTIPVIPAGGGSPIKQPIKSMKDLVDAKNAVLKG